MMKCAIFGDNTVDILRENGITHDRNADIALVEAGMPLPEKPVCIVYRPDALNKLFDILRPQAGQNGTGSAEFISCRDGERIKLVRYNEVEYFAADGNDVFCYLTHGETMNVKKKIYELEKKLFDRGFFRVSKSTLVNIREIKDISPWFGGKLLLRLKNGTDEIEVTRKYVGDFKEYLGV